MKIIESTESKTVILFEDNEDTHIIPGKETTISFGRGAPLVTVNGTDVAIIVVEKETDGRPANDCCVSVFCKQWAWGVMRITEAKFSVCGAGECEDTIMVVHCPECLEFNDVRDLCDSQWASAEMMNDTPEDREPLIDDYNNFRIEDDDPEDENLDSLLGDIGDENLD